MKKFVSKFDLTGHLPDGFAPSSILMGQENYRELRKLTIKTEPEMNAIISGNSRPVRKPRTDEQIEKGLKAFINLELKEEKAPHACKCLWCKAKIEVNAERVSVYRYKKCVATFCSRRCQKEKQDEFLQEKQKGGI